MKFRKASIIAAIAASLAVTFTAPQRVEAQQQAVGQANFGNLIAALNNLNVNVQRLRALNNLTLENIRVVNVENLLNGNNVRALNNALNRNNVEVANLRNFLNDPQCSVVAVCDALKNFLNNNKVDIGQVVAVDVLSGGDVILFVQPQQ